MGSLLTLDGVVAGYGSASVLHGVSIDVPEGETAVILGPNGAGKTTTLRTITGLLRAWRGAVRLDGLDISRLRPGRIVQMGVGLVPAAPGVFRDLSVVDNLRVGGFALAAGKRRVASRLAWVLDAFPMLARREGQRAGTLSGGEQRVLAIARALMGEPRLLLVDEASMGLSPHLVSTIFEMLDGVRAGGLTMCMVEQSPAALDFADRAYILTKGEVVDTAVGADLVGVRERAASAYLGGTGAVA